MDAFASLGDADIFSQLRIVLTDLLVDVAKQFAKAVASELRELVIEFIEYLKSLFKKDTDDNRESEYHELTDSHRFLIYLISYISPRSPPVIYPEKIECLYFYMKLKYDKYLISVLLLILSNEIYTNSREIFRILFGF